jgi:hypothetical protein
MFPTVYQNHGMHALVLRHCSKPHEAPDPRLLTRQLSDPSGEGTTLRSSRPLRQLDVTFHIHRDQAFGYLGTGHFARV